MFKLFEKKQKAIYKVHLFSAKKEDHFWIPPKASYYTALFIGSLCNTAMFRNQTKEFISKQNYILSGDEG